MMDDCEGSGREAGSTVNEGKHASTFNGERLNVQWREAGSTVNEVNQASTFIGERLNGQWGEAQRSMERVRLNRQQRLSVGCDGAWMGLTSCVHHA